MAGNHNEIEKKLWEAADQLRANSRLKSSEYALPVLGLIFLRYADHKFTIIDNEIKKQKKDTESRIGITKAEYQAKGVLFLENCYQTTGDKKWSFLFMQWTSGDHWDLFDGTKIVAQDDRLSGNRHSGQLYFWQAR